jgi:hypothetical protein
MNGTNNSKTQTSTKISKKIVVDPDVDPDQNFENSSGAQFIVLVAHHRGIAVAHLKVSSGEPNGASLVLGLPFATAKPLAVTYPSALLVAKIVVPLINLFLVVACSGHEAVCH